MTGGQNSCPREAYILEGWNMMKIQKKKKKVISYKAGQGDGVERHDIGDPSVKYQWSLRK